MRNFPQPLVIFRRSSCSVPANKLRHTAELLYRNEHVPFSRKIAVIFCSDIAIRKLNVRFRKIDSATDVLSFAFSDEDLLGEIYISPRRAAVQARRYGVSCSEEVLRLFIHGFYHLLGYDHKTERRFKEMEKKEKRALLLSAKKTG
jgi:probable rRNA maturation factor